MHNLTCDKQVILLMISNGENWHYLTVKNLPGLLRGIISNHKVDFYCLNCFRSYRAKINSKKTKKYEYVPKYPKLINIKLKLINIHHRVIRYLFIVHLIKQKINSIIIEVKIV